MIWGYPHLRKHPHCPEAPRGGSCPPTPRMGEAGARGETTAWTRRSRSSSFTAAIGISSCHIVTRDARQGISKKPGYKKTMAQQIFPLPFGTLFSRSWKTARLNDGRGLSGVGHSPSFEEALPIRPLLMRITPAREPTKSRSTEGTFPCGLKTVNNKQQLLEAT